MASNDREVQLIISAKDEAKKTLNAVSAALKEFTTQQKGAETQTGKTGSLVEELAHEFRNLDRLVRGAQALGKAQKQFQGMSAEAERLNRTLQRTKERASELTQSYGEAAQRTRKLRAEATQATRSLDAQQRVVDDLRASQKALVGERSQDATDSRAILRDRLRGEREELQRLRKAAKEADAALIASETNQAKLRKEATGATKSLTSQRQELGKLTGQVVKVSKSIQTAQSSLGPLADEHGNLSKQAEAAAADLEKVNMALAKQQKVSAASTSTGPAAQATRAYRQQAQVVRDAETAWKEARQEATRLGQEVRNTTSPTRELQTAFTLSKAASVEARQEYAKQAKALRDLQLQSKNSGGFAGFDARAESLNTGYNAFERYRKHLEKVRKGTAGFEKQNRGARASLDRLAQSILGANRAARTGGRQISGYADSFKKMHNESRKALSFSQRLRGEIVSLTVAYLGLYNAINQISEVVDAFRSLEAVESRLGVVYEQDLAKAAKEVQFLREESIRLGFSFEILGDTYSRFAVAANKAGFANESVRSIFLGVAEAARVNKVSMDQLNGTFIALEQMISKGKVTSEELRRQLGDRLTGAFQFFADAMGMTTQQLDEALDRGEVFARESSLLDFADKLREKFGPQLGAALETMTAQMGRFQALMFDFRIQVAEAGFAEELRVSIDELNETFKSEEGEEFAERLGYGLSNLTQIVITLIKNFDLFLFAVKAFVAVKLAKFVGAVVLRLQDLYQTVRKTSPEVRLLSVRMATLSNHIVAAGNASLGSRAEVLLLAGGLRVLRIAAVTTLGAVRAVVLALGGIVGVALTAATFIAGSMFADAATSASDATEALNRHRRVLKDVRDEYEKTGQEVDDWAEKLRDASKVELEVSLVRLREELNDLVEGLDDNFFQRELLLGSGARTRNLLQPVVDDFNDGILTAEKFRKKVEEIWETAKADGTELDAEIFERALNATEKMGEFENRITQTERLLKAIEDGSREATEEVLGLNNAFEGSSEAARAADALKDYEEAVRSIKEFIPELKDELERLDDLAAIDALEERLMERGPISPENRNLLDRARAEVNTTDEQERQQKRAEDFLEERKRIAEQLELEREKLGESAKEQFVLTELAKREADAREAGLDYSRFRDEDRKRAEELYELQNAERIAAQQREKVEERVNNLVEIRRGLMEQIEFFQNQGDQQSAEALKERLQGVNDSLREAIDNAIEFWKSVGGPDAEAAILKYENLQNRILDLKKTVLPTAEEINDSIADGAVNAFDKFAEALANGQNAFKAFGDAVRSFFADFLQMIAKAILQQMILNALGGGSGGGGIGGSISGAIAGLFHEGGVVGQASTVRAADPGWFRNALRYHTGGIAGLKPGEVPAILERGEEVLTESDPRHVNNGGGSSSPGNVKIVNAIDAGSFISEGLNSKSGEKSLLNYIRANQGAVKNALGV